MKLSMWILADWLKKYQPEADIRSGEICLHNVRLFAENTVTGNLSPSTVYLETMDKDKVICTNRNDILTLHTDDINQVFNDILDAFEFYNDYTEELYTRIEGGCALSEVMEAVTAMLQRPLILADATFYMREICDYEGILINNKGLSKSVPRRLLPIDQLLSINSQTGIRQKSVRTYLVTVPDVGTAAITNIFAHDRHMGWIISESRDMHYSQGDMDLQDDTAGLFGRWFEKNENQEQQSIKSGMFLPLLSEEGGQDESIVQRLKTFEWEEDDPKQIYVLRELDKQQKTVRHTPDSFLENLSKNSFFLQYEGIPLYIINCRLTKQEEFRQEFFHVLDLCGCIAGESPAFTNIFDIRTYFQMARIAAYFAPETGLEKLLQTRVIRFQETIIPYSMDLLKTHTASDLRHPALNLLRSYDQQHHTELYHTLHSFLQNKCSSTDTSRALFIHRSTFLYRLERISQMTGIDFNNPDERFHLELSFYLDKQL